MPQTNINIRMDSEVKKQAEELFSDLGMNMTTAINIFVKQSIRTGGIPFQIVRDDDPFNSASNQEHLRRAIEQLESGEATMITKTIAELEAMADG